MTLWNALPIQCFLWSSGQLPFAPFLSEVMQIYYKNYFFSLRSGGGGGATYILTFIHSFPFCKMFGMSCFFPGTQKRLSHCGEILGLKITKSSSSNNDISTNNEWPESQVQTVTVLRNTFTCTTSLNSLNSPMKWFCCQYVHEDHKARRD